MPTKRHNIRYNPNAGPISFGNQADKDAELARLDECIADAKARNDKTILKIAQQRRRKVSGWKVG